MSVVLIDTDVAIDYLRGDPSIQALVNRLWREGKAAFSVLSVYELLAGIREKEEMATMDFLAACRLVEVSREVALKGGELYRKYRSRGITLSAVDCLIAATAMIYGMKVATRNTKHYPEKGILLNL